jgi:type IV pilus assembly protein PilA
MRNLRDKNYRQSGFSLVELMIVVAIIGILSSIAVPQFQRFIFKSRQTEAKTGLASLYTAEKAFYGEWSQYSPQFGTIGYEPTGKYYYNIGFKDTTGIATNKNYDSETQLVGYANANSQNINDACAATSGGKCQKLSNVATALGGTHILTNNATSFRAGAIANNIDGSNSDTWHVDDNKDLSPGS